MGQLSLLDKPNERLAQITEGAKELSFPTPFIFYTCHHIHLVRREDHDCGERGKHGFRVMVVFCLKGIENGLVLNAAPVLRTIMHEELLQGRRGSKKLN